MVNIIQEKSYLVAKNDDNDLLFSLSEKQGKPENPYLLYDGKDHAALYRKDGQVIVLDYINPNVKSCFINNKKAKFLESSNNKVTFSYDVPVKVVKTLPDSLYRTIKTTK